MDPDTNVIEGTAFPLNAADSKTMRTICDMLSDLGQFSYNESSRGTLFSVNGFIGQVKYKDGGSINIVPCFSGKTKPADAPLMLMEMLYSVFGIQTKRIEYSNLFEFCIRIFIEAVELLITKGLRNKYHSVEGNEKVFKGRIVFNEHIRQNYIHKERIYVEYEIFSPNRPENRLIKATINTLLRHSTDSQNKKTLKTLLLTLEEIPASDNIERDFESCVMDRNMVDYIEPMMWCNIFLKGMGLSGGSKANYPYALLIQTDVLYSAYVAKMSTVRRRDGVYLLNYSADIKIDDSTKELSTIIINLDWSFFNREKEQMLKDPIAMYMSAPGYREIPRSSMHDQLSSMTLSYLIEQLGKPSK